MMSLPSNRTDDTTPQQGQVPAPGNMSVEERQAHKRNVMKMMAAGQPPAAIASYLDSVGVPRKKPIIYPPEVQDNPGLVGGMLLSAIQGATFGFGDEAIGSLMGLVTDKTVDQGIDMVRAQMARFKKDHPVLGAAGEIGGAIGSGGGLLKLAGKGLAMTAPRAMQALSGAGTLANVARTAVSAGAGGGLYAAGNAEGGIEQRLESVPRGAALGAALGGTMSAIAGGVGTITRPLVRQIPLGVKLPGVGTASDQADEILRLNLERDGASIDDLIAKARQAATQGKPLTLSDLAGQNTVGLLSAVQSVPGQGKQILSEALTGRQMDQGERLLNSLTGKTKIGIQNVTALRDRLAGMRAAEAQPLYAEAYQQSVPLDAHMQMLINHPIFKRAYSVGSTIAKTDGIDLPPLMRQMAGATTNFAEGNIATKTVESVADQIPVQGFDYMKRGLEKLIETGKAGKYSIDRTSARSLRNRLELLLQQVDTKVPQYGMARAKFRGDSEVIDALDLGREFLKTHPNEINKAMAGLKSQAEREMYKVGAFESIRDMIYSNKATAPNLARAVFGGKTMENRMRALLGDDADDFIDAVRTEARMSEVFNSLRGSRTTPLAKVVEDLEGQANLPSISPTAGTSNMLMAAGKWAQNRARTGFTEQVADALASKLRQGTDNPQDLIGLLFGLKATAQKVGQRSAVKSGSAALGAAAQSAF